MAENIILDLQLNTSGAEQSIEQIETSLQQMKNAIKSVPTDSQAFKTLQANIQKADVQLKGLNKSLEGIGKAQVGEALGKIAGGATAAVAGFSLLSQAMGTSKESAEEMQKSLNLAFGVIAGVKGVVELFQGLSAILPLVANGFKVLSAVMAANPIGAVIVGITALIGVLGLFSYESDKATKSQENLTEAEKKHKEALEELIEEQKLYHDITLLANKSTEDLTKSVNSLFDSLIELEKLNTTYAQSANDIVDANGNIVLSQDLIKLSDTALLDLQKRINDASTKSGESQVAANEDAAYSLLLLEKQLNGLFQTRQQIYKDSPPDFDITQTIEFKNNVQEIERVQKEIEVVKKQRDESQLQRTNALITAQNLSLQVEEEIKKRGLISPDALKRQKEQQDLLEKRIQLTRELNDLLDKYAFIERENVIRSTKEGIDLIEERNIALLNREQEFSDAKKEIDRSEVLNKKQKADALKIIEEQYRLDLIDINASYDEKQKQQDNKNFLESQNQINELFEYELDLKNRSLLANAELNAIKNKDSLDAQIKFLDAQRKVELDNTELTKAERELIEEKYHQRRIELEKESAKKIKQHNIELLSELQGLYSNFASLIQNIMEGNLQAFEQIQDRQLYVFEQNQSAQLAAAEATGENVDAIQKKLAAEKEIFQQQQEQRLKEQQKKIAQRELALMVIQSIGNIAGAIAKAQVNPGFPLSIAETIRITAIGVAQIAAIQAQINKINSFAQGGVIDGPSHAQGGVRFAVGGQVNELEGGEGVINKRSMAIPGVSQAASYLNQLGGGVAFNTNSVKNTQVATLTSIMSSSKESIVRAYVLESDISDAQTLNNRIRKKAKF